MSNVSSGHGVDVGHEGCGKTTGAAGTSTHFHRRTDVDKCEAHILPCHISYTGEGAVNKFFRPIPCPLPESIEDGHCEGAAPSPPSSAMRMDTRTIWRSTFHGRQLFGRELTGGRFLTAAVEESDTLPFVEPFKRRCERLLAAERPSDAGRRDSTGGRDVVGVDGDGGSSKPTPVCEGEGEERQKEGEERQKEGEERQKEGEEGAEGVRDLPSAEVFDYSALGLGGMYEDPSLDAINRDGGSGATGTGTRSERPHPAERGEMVATLKGDSTVTRSTTDDGRLRAGRVLKPLKEISRLMYWHHDDKPHPSDDITQLFYLLQLQTALHKYDYGTEDSVSDEDSLYASGDSKGGGGL